MNREELDAFFAKAEDVLTDWDNSACSFNTEHDETWLDEPIRQDRDSTPEEDARSLLELLAAPLVEGQLLYVATTRRTFAGEAEWFRAQWMRGILETQGEAVARAYYGLPPEIVTDL